ncbi:hypothetical protein QQF64_023869 [Cirrhinus molitorella]|uniref:Gypsy retrotransposon integrase-like protein 1 n=1 Tax=Cirrhinus molitorella TaxID=172907 RepID=A0ABR3NJM6_9TELE
MFHDWEFKPRQPARDQAGELMRIVQHWLLDGSPSASQVAERVVIDRFQRALPWFMRQAVNMRDPKTVLELVEAIEFADAAFQCDTGERAPPFPRTVALKRRMPEGTQRPVNRPAPPTPRDEPVPTDPLSPPIRKWLAGCIVHQETPPGAPEITVEIQGRNYQALLDSGSAVTLVHENVLRPRVNSKMSIPITCVHGDTRYVPARRVNIRAAEESWPVEVGVVRDLPVPVLLGRDWPGLEKSLALVSQPANTRRRRHRRWRLSRGQGHRMAFLTMDSGRDGEPPSRDTNLFFDVFQQVRRIEDEVVHPAPHPLPHFIVQNGLLYCVAQRRGEEKQLHVVPKSKVDVILEFAHSHPLAGHLGAQNTIERIRDRFHWPGLEAEVKRFCQACPTCQLTSPRKPPPSPLIPLPNIGVPFEHIGMDLVGLLPKSGRGHEHILVIVDYATRYPEAVPLRKATPKAITNELFLLSSRIRTSIYHPQTDGLVERFNQTLKQMLRRVAFKDKKDWDLLLPYVLFGIREVPQASTGFTPFELLFGRQPRGLLEVAKEAWEQQPAAHRTVIEHVREMRERIDRVMPLVREHLVRAQQSQQCHYNRAVQPREFQPGDKVMVLVPNAACKFLATWQGPYTRWVGNQDQLVALALTEPVVVDINPELSATQKTELRHLVGQFQDVFSENPGHTHILRHDIKTPPGVIVRQRPYRVPEARRHAIEEEVLKMLKLGVIEPSQSPWSSPIVLVPKPDGTLWFCNFRLRQLPHAPSG